MRAIAAMALSLTASSAAAAPPVWTPGMPWRPIEPYIVIGQDEPGYRNWYLASPRNPAEVAALNTYLLTYGVAGVVPTWQLLRTASDWYKCGAPAFEVPPSENWPNVVQTLRYIRDKVIPVLGPVEPVSAYRNPMLNACAKGAPESAHRFMQAVDLVPLSPITRAAMIDKLCAVHERSGQAYGVGLGFYVGLRFHIDSRKFRTWGINDQGGIACPGSYQIAHQNDAQSGSGDTPSATPPAASPQPPTNPASPPNQ